MPEDTHTMFWAKHVDIPIDKTDPHMVSSPIELEKSGCQVFVNADGLSEQSAISVEILDEQFKPIAGYSADDCVPLVTSGLRQAVTWRKRQHLEKFDHPIRIKVAWTGSRLEDANLYAVYLNER